MLGNLTKIFGLFLPSFQCYVKNQCLSYPGVYVLM
jgi:hypothetical protein